jgi:DNA (cytosine-5)-methyltransferase 1
MDAFIYDMRLVHEQSQKDLFKVVSLFAGAGGSSTGYKLAGGKVLAINEFLEEAQDTYQVNYPDTHIFKQDIRELTGDMILNQIGLKRGELDILDGSPPCASFSTAGKKEKCGVK